VLQRLSQALNPHGTVVLGAAETVIGLSDALVPDPDHRGAYVRASAREPAAALRVAAGIR